MSDWPCRMVALQAMPARLSRLDRVKFHNQTSQPGFSMKPILFSLLLISLGQALPAQNYTLGPDSQPQDGVPKGAVTKFVLPPGKSYPGTPHNCAVYVPAQYDASKPTPFMIFFDGSQALGDS